MLADFEQIQADIINSCRIAEEAEGKAAQQEQEIRGKYEKALARKAAALDSGNMDEYREAGMEAEARRLEVEFIDKTKHKRMEPAATAEEDSRIRAGLQAEVRRIRAEGLSRVREMQREMTTECENIRKQLAAVENLYKQWQSVVMHKQKQAQEQIVPDHVQICFAQIENAARAELTRTEQVLKM